MADRFPELSENDSTSLIDRKNSEHTKKGTKFQRISKVSQGKKGRRDSCHRREGQVGECICTREILHDAEARKKNGELYTKASLVGIRFENCEILQLC